MSGLLTLNATPIKASNRSVRPHSVDVHHASVPLFVEASRPLPPPAPVLPGDEHAPRHRVLRVIFVSIYPNVLFSSLLLGFYCGRPFLAGVFPILLFL